MQSYQFIPRHLIIPRDPKAYRDTVYFRQRNTGPVFDFAVPLLRTAINIDESRFYESSRTDPLEETYSQPFPSRFSKEVI